jgi:hypothetical protein
VANQKRGDLKMKPKNPCKACPVGNGGHICDRAKNGKSLCPDYAFYALYQAQCKIRAMVDRKLFDRACVLVEIVLSCRDYQDAVNKETGQQLSALREAAKKGTN